MLMSIMFTRSRICKIVLILLFSLMISGCAGEPIDPSVFQSEMGYNDVELMAKGIGSGTPGKGVSNAEAKLHAAQMAELNAAEILVEAMQGVAVMGDMSLYDVYIEESRLLQIMEANITEMRQKGKTIFQKQEDGSWLASFTAVIPHQHAFESVKSVIQQPEFRRRIRDLQPNPDNSPDFSGIVIDLRLHKGYSPLLAPSILDFENIELFSVRDFAPEAFSITGGMKVFSTYRAAAEAQNGVGQFQLKLIVAEFDPVKMTLKLTEESTMRFETSKNGLDLVKAGKVVLIYN